MGQPVALRERGRLAVLLHSLVRQALAETGGPAPDPRNLRTWRQFVLGVRMQRSVRLVRVAQAVWPARRAQSVKTTAAALGYLLSQARWALRPFSTRWLLAAVQQVAPDQWARYRGYVLAVVDATEYPNRSRGRGKGGRPMQDIGRVRRAANGPPQRRQPTTKRAAGNGASPAAVSPRRTTSYGYVDCASVAARRAPMPGELTRKNLGRTPSGRDRLTTGQRKGILVPLMRNRTRLGEPVE